MQKKTIIILAVIIAVSLIGIWILNDNEEVAEEGETIYTQTPADNNEVENPIINDEPELEAKDPAIDFTLKDLEGNDVSLSDFEGKIVLLNFWATWCKFCDIEMPDLEKLYTENEGILVLGVNVGEDIDLVKEYVDEKNLSFPIVLDETTEIASDYLVSGLPTTYFIDENGMIYGVFPGMMTYDMMTGFLEDMKEQ
ncbi:TlpA family protein disulfide reductase [Soehngenia longivitae]|uniref:TlpA family protein disulfide reductase n=1 Tax=Soehngenia longivitae TaxID=2562294 RepID=A0A4Z0D8Z5_9FIRM|nr:TlpA disulfide reductase family protein [Soehngenia longivitae]TFZ41350.1 TlpA family protein disulfide reductase [Soehngenia longivitae]